MSAERLQPGAESHSRDLGGERGYAMAALLVALSVMAVVLSVAMPSWQTLAKREREAELIFRAEQYARAVRLYQQARGAYPPSIDVLVNERFLRKKYKDPMTEDGEFQIIRLGDPLPGQAATAPSPRGNRSPAANSGGARDDAATAFLEGLSGRAGPALAPRPAGGAGGGPVLGVVSKSTQTSLRTFNGRTKYNEWAFVATDATTAAGAGGEGGSRQPGGGNRGGNAGPGGGLRLPGTGIGGSTGGTRGNTPGGTRGGSFGRPAPAGGSGPQSPSSGRGTPRL